MSGEKTEKPTDKKLRDSAKKGQSFKNRDLVICSVLLMGIFGFPLVPFSRIQELFVFLIGNMNELSVEKAAIQTKFLFFQLTIPFLAICIITVVVASLLQSKFQLAFEAIKFDFAGLNPISGFKKIFSAKSLKELIKTLIFLCVFCFVVYCLVIEFRSVVIGFIYLEPGAIVQIEMQLVKSVLKYCLLAFIPIVFLEAFVDFFLYIRDLMMDKHEVKQEYKQQEGNLEMKSHRRSLQHELLSEQTKNDVEQSSFVLANPTHIAIGIYINLAISAMPYVSVVAKGARAKAIVEYAEKKGVTVVRDITLARRLIKVVRPYTFVPNEWLDNVLHIYVWLKQVEQAANSENESAELTSEKK